MKLSVIIPAYNEEKYLAATLESISIALARFATVAEIIVVDNESNDRTSTIAVATGARLITESVHNIARVRNTGARAALGEILVFIDADTQVQPGLFEQIIQNMHDEKCFGGAVSVDYKEFERKSMRLYSLAWKFWANVFNMKGGAAQFCRKTIFENIGGYDERIYLGEDVEFYWRLSKFAKSSSGFLHFVKEPAVITSTRRFDKMNFWKTLLVTHPFYIFLNWKRKAPWKDWYEEPIR